MYDRNLNGKASLLTFPNEKKNRLNTPVDVDFLPFGRLSAVK